MTLQNLTNTRDYNVGTSNYATLKVQPWDLWTEFNLDGHSADIVKRLLRDKGKVENDLDFDKIMHILDYMDEQAERYDQRCKAAVKDIDNGQVQELIYTVLSHQRPDKRYIDGLRMTLKIMKNK